MVRGLATCLGPGTPALALGVPCHRLLRGGWSQSNPPLTALLLLQPKDLSLTLPLPAPYPQLPGSEPGTGLLVPMGASRDGLHCRVPTTLPP